MAAHDGLFSLNPNSFTNSIASKVTWLPCPSKINKSQLLKDTPLGMTY